MSTLKVLCDEVISDVKVQGVEVIYEEVKVQREGDGTREQQQRQQQLQQTRLQQQQQDHKKSIYMLKVQGDK